MLVPRTFAGLLRLAANRNLRINQLKQAVFRQATSAAARGSSSSDVPPGFTTTSIDELLPRLRNASLVIFDKDGTLICFHSMWAPWAHQFVERLEADTQLSIRDKVFNLLGFDAQTQRFRPGLLAEATMFIIKERMAELLVQEGLEHEAAVKVLDRCWQNCDATNEANLKSLGNLPDLFKALKDWGIKTAICTADTRAGTLPALKKLGVDNLVDKVMCSDDHGSQPKPNPHNALRICEELNVSPERAIMVGDTSADTGLAKNAKLGTAIGVLSGVGSHKDLHEADYLLDSVENILTIAMNDGAPPGSGSNSRGGGQYIGQRQYSTNTSGTRAGAPEYSHVIIGAGSAGCVLTNRLSENPSSTVLLLEAGPKDYTWKIHMPSALMYNLCDDKYNWYYTTVPQKHMDNREMYWPRGRVWGGSSSLNAMVYIRGHALDYDRWEKEGASGWSYADCLPYFQKAQTHELGPDDYRGGDGPLHVSRGKSMNPLNEAFIEAAQQAGYPFTADMNGYQQEGFGDMDMTIHNGIRWSTANAYLRPALKRTNVTAEVKCMVTRLLFEGNRAVGVEYIQNGETKQVRAAEEIILSGGAINSPQLLMLSGVGDADELQKLGIPVVQHLPGVGQNLQDHLEVYVQQACTQPVTLYSSLFPHRMLMIGVQWFALQTGLGASSHLEAGGFTRSRPGVEHPDIQYHFLPSTVNDHGRVAGTEHAYQVHVGSMRPTSRGYLKLRSADPHVHPLLEPNYMSTDQDVLEMRLGIKQSREIFAQKAFDPFRGQEIAPGDSVQSDKDIDAFARKMSDSAYHPSCTCKMGAEWDKMAVVDAETRVFGLENLRVVDASIMPSIVSGNLNAPTIMLTEKAADIIKGEPPLPKSTAPVYQPKTLDTQR